LTGRQNKNSFYFNFIEYPVLSANLSVSKYENDDTLFFKFEKTRQVINIGNAHIKKAKGIAAHDNAKNVVVRLNKVWLAKRL